MPSLEADSKQGTSSGGGRQHLGLPSRSDRTCYLPNLINHCISGNLWHAKHVYCNDVLSQARFTGATFKVISSLKADDRRRTLVLNVGESGNFPIASVSFSEPSPKLLLVQVKRGDVTNQLYRDGEFRYIKVLIIYSVCIGGGLKGCRGFEVFNLQTLSTVKLWKQQGRKTRSLTECGKAGCQLTKLCVWLENQREVRITFHIY